MSKNRLSNYGLKWNPFSQQVPVEALRTTPALESFASRVENLARDGGFALITGDPGSGKSVAMRLLEARLARIRDLHVGVLTRPQSRLADFYRELGDLFGVALTPHNRWAGTKVLRERWLAFADTTLHRPVLLVDEGQEMLAPVLNELRLLASVALDSRLLLTVVLAGDRRLAERLRKEDLLPLASRIRARLDFAAASADELAATLRFALDAAGNERLLSDGLVTTLAEHAAGNHRTLMNLASTLFDAAIERDIERLDEKLFFDVFASAHTESVAAGRTKRRAS